MAKQQQFSLQDIIDDTEHSREERIKFVMNTDEDIETKIKAIKHIESQKEPTLAEKSLAELNRLKEEAAQAKHEENLKKIKEGANAVGKVLDTSRKVTFRGLGSMFGKVIKGSIGEFKDAYDRVQ